MLWAYNLQRGGIQCKGSTCKLLTAPQRTQSHTASVLLNHFIQLESEIHSHAKVQTWNSGPGEVKSKNSPTLAQAVSKPSRSLGYKHQNSGLGTEGWSWALQINKRHSALPWTQGSLLEVRVRPVAEIYSLSIQGLLREKENSPVWRVLVGFFCGVF